MGTSQGSSRGLPWPERTASLLPSHCLSYFLYKMQKQLDHSSGVHATVVKSRRQSLVSLLTQHTQSRRPAYFFFFLQSRIPSQGMEPPTVGRPSHFNLPNEGNLPQVHPMVVSRKCLDPIKLNTDLDHHRLPSLHPWVGLPPPHPGKGRLCSKQEL